MIRAAAGVRVTYQIMRNPDVAHLRMHHAMKNAAVDDRAAADARADGEIKKVGQVLRRAPAGLAQRGRVHVGVKTNRHAQRIAHRARQIVILPAGLRRGGDIAERKRGAVQIDRPKRTDPHRLQFAAGFLAQKFNGDGQRGLGRGRGKLHRLQVRWPGSHSTNEFGATCFDRTEHIFDMRPKESATEPRRDKM